VLSQKILRIQSTPSLSVKSLLTIPQTSKSSTSQEEKVHTLTLIQLPPNASSLLVLRMNGACIATLPPISLVLMASAMMKIALMAIIMILPSKPACSVTQAVRLAMALDLHHVALALKISLSSSMDIASFNALSTLSMAKTMIVFAIQVVPPASMILLTSRLNVLLVV